MFRTSTFTWAPRETPQLNTSRAPVRSTEQEHNQKVKEGKVGYSDAFCTLRHRNFLIWRRSFERETVNSDDGSQSTGQPVSMAYVVSCSCCFSNGTDGKSTSVEECLLSNLSYALGSLQEPQLESGKLILRVRVNLLSVFLAGCHRCPDTLTRAYPFYRHGNTVPHKRTEAVFAHVFAGLVLKGHWRSNSISLQVGPQQ